MSETQKTISDWASETFGPVGSHLRVAARANEEMAELLRALTTGAPMDKVASEVADVMIVLFRLAERLGCDVEQELTGVDQMPWLHHALPIRCATSANAYMSDMLVALSAQGVGDPEFAKQSLILIFAALHHLAEGGFSIPEAVEAKMKINRARVWKLDGSGHGYHVRPDRPEDPGKVIVNFVQTKEES